jgi:hypothetical protein
MRFSEDQIRYGLATAVLCFVQAVVINHRRGNVGVPGKLLGLGKATP